MANHDAEEQRLWLCLEMAGPHGQSSGANAAIEVFNSLEELCLDLSLFLSGHCSLYCVRHFNTYHFPEYCHQSPNQPTKQSSNQSLNSCFHNHGHTVLIDTP